MTVTGRFAPSPSGSLHLGNAMTFLLAWLSVRSRNGRMILRIEDLQPDAKTEDYITENIEDLRTLGLDWDEGYASGSTPHEPYRQSECRSFYRRALNELIAQNKVYPCICSRKDVRAAQGAPHAGEYQFYPGNCRGRFETYAQASAMIQDPNRIPAWRFRAPEKPVTFTDLFAGKQCVDIARLYGDFPIARDPDAAGYQLAVVVDDARMGVTEVLRGEDLLPAAAWQLALSDALKFSRMTYVHTPLVVDSNGNRLAKRHHHYRLRTLFEQGVLPENIIGFLAYLCGLSPKNIPLRPADLLVNFSLSNLHQGPCAIPLHWNVTP